MRSVEACERDHWYNDRRTGDASATEPCFVGSISKSRWVVPFLSFLCKTRTRRVASDHPGSLFACTCVCLQCSVFPFVWFSTECIFQSWLLQLKNGTGDVYITMICNKNVTVQICSLSLVFLGRHSYYILHLLPLHLV